MARFYTSTDNARGNPVTAMSHKGQNTHTRGWNGGVRVVSSADGESDVFDIYLTSGSNGRESDKLLATLTVFADGSGEVLDKVGPSDRIRHTPLRTSVLA